MSAVEVTVRQFPRGDGLGAAGGTQVCRLRWQDQPPIAPAVQFVAGVLLVCYGFVVLMCQRSY